MASGLHTLSFLRASSAAASVWASRLRPSLALPAPERCGMLRRSIGAFPQGGSGGRRARPHRAHLSSSDAAAAPDAVAEQVASPRTGSSKQSPSQSSQLSQSSQSADAPPPPRRKHARPRKGPTSLLRVAVEAERTIDRHRHHAPPAPQRAHLATKVRGKPPAQALPHSFTIITITHRKLWAFFFFFFFGRDGGLGFFFFIFI